MPALALAVVAIALPDSLNPTLIVAAVLLAAQRRPFLRTLAFTVAAFAVTLAGGLVIALGLGDLILALVPKPSNTVKWWLITFAGLVLIVGGAGMWIKRRALGSAPDPQAHHEGGGGSALAMGAGIAGIEFLTAFPYFAAIALIVGSSVGAASKVALLVLYNLVYVLPLIVIVVLCAVMGERAGRMLTPVGDWISLRWPVVVAPLAEAAGVALAVYGVVHLT